LIADVVFDLPRMGAFTYRVPSEMDVAVGQRVRAPLQRRLRIGIVVALHEAAGEGLKGLDGTVEPGPLLGPVQLGLTRWISSESYSSWGSTLAALLPPLPPRSEVAQLKRPSGHEITQEAPARAKGVEASGPHPPARLLTGADREESLLNLLAAEGRTID